MFPAERSEAWRIVARRHPSAFLLAAQLLSLLANAWVKAGHIDKAQAWLPALQRLAPRDPVTVWLAQR